MDTETKHVSLITSRLRRVRRTLYLASILEGVGYTLLAVTLLFWTSFAFDWLIDRYSDPTRIFRLLVAIVFAIIAIAAAGYWLFWRLLARVSLHHVALMIERRFPALEDRVVTALELGQGRHPFSQPLVARAASEAAGQLAALPLDSLVARGRAALRLTAGIACAAFVLGWIAVEPLYASVWRDRFFYLSDRRYPRQTHLQLVGFVDGIRKVARGRDLEILITPERGTRRPNRVTLRYELRQTGSSGRVVLSSAADGSFRHVFRNVVEPLTLQALGGDDRTAFHHVELVEPPLLSMVELRAVPPPHTREPARTLRYAGAPLSVAQETDYELTIGATKPLSWMRVASRLGDLPMTRINETTFQRKGRLGESLQLKAMFEDNDGITPLEPFLIEINATPDAPPILESTLVGIGSAVTRLARVPVRLKAKDDYGIAKLEFEWQRGSASAEQRAGEATPTDKKTMPAEATASAASRQPVSRLGSPEGQDGTEPPPGDVTANTPVFVTETVAFDLIPLDLSPSDRLDLMVVATDNDPLHGPHETRSERYHLEIVAPEELLARLATRELQMRLRFEQILGEIRSARASLAALEAGLSVQDDEPGQRRRLTLESAGMNLRKNRGETEGIAAAFRDILAEIRNNRVGNPALTDRIDQGIVQPLDQLQAESFPPLDRDLETMRSALLENRPVGEMFPRLSTGYNELVARCEAILRAMRKLEDFNEVIGSLRTIIAEQDRLLERTRAKQKQAVLDLLK